LRLKPLAFGLACGTIGGVGLALLTLCALLRGKGAILGKLGGYYPGYSISATGVVVGALWGFAHAFVAAAALAWLYNRFAGK
jgi:hypothetical protein